jgi:glycosyltransferase involved in cell wall biosynthesis
VSVVIATLDRPDYLRQAIASALRNNYQNFEIVVSDDAGPPENSKVVASFRDPRIRYRRNTTRLGSALNHKAALTIATGEYIILLNDDDEWEPNCLGPLVAALRDHPEVLMAFGDHYIMNAEGVIDAAGTEEATRRWKRDRLTPGLHKPFCEIALVDQSISMGASLLRRDAIDWNDSPEEVGSLYDFWIVYLACRTGGGAWYCPERLFRYRIHSRNETSVGGERTARSTAYVYSRIVEDPLLKDLRKRVWPKLMRAKLGYGLYLLENGNARQARKNLWEPLIRGRHLRAAIAIALSILPFRFRTVLLRRLRATNRISQER